MRHYSLTRDVNSSYRVVGAILSGTSVAVDRQRELNCTSWGRDVKALRQPLTRLCNNNTRLVIDYSCLQAYVDLVKAWGWKSFTIIYDSNDGLVRLQELLKAHGPSEFPITVRQLSEGSEYR